MPIIGKGAYVRVTERLRLEPITVDRAEDYSLVFRDDAVAVWYAGKLTLAEAQRDANEAEHIWKTVGFHKWLVYELASGTVVGRAGLSAMHLHAYDGAIRSFLPQHSWADERMDVSEANNLARRWVEIGWALRGEYWGRGYASELGRYGLRVAFGELDMHAVVSYTERHNLRSRAVMERIGMTYAGEFLGTGLIEGREGVHDGAPFALYLALRDTWRSE
jgi:RimJ/RimL family protein N-acetyltransferase